MHLTYHSYLFKVVLIFLLYDIYCLSQWRGIYRQPFFCILLSDICLHSSVLVILSFSLSLCHYVCISLSLSLSFSLSLILSLSLSLSHPLSLSLHLSLSIYLSFSLSLIINPSPKADLTLAEMKELRAARFGKPVGKMKLKIAVFGVTRNYQNNSVCWLHHLRLQSSSILGNLFSSSLILSYVF